MNSFEEILVYHDKRRLSILIYILIVSSMEADDPKYKRAQYKNFKKGLRMNFQEKKLNQNYDYVQINS